MPNGNKQEPAASARPTVAHLLWSLKWGGAELLLLKLVRLSGSRFQHSVCCLGQDGPLRSDFENAGCAVRVLGKSRRRDLPAVLARGGSLLREAKPDLVHLHRDGPDAWGQFIALAGRRHRLVVTEHSTYGAAPGQLLLACKTILRRALRNQIFKTAAISQAVADDLVARRLVDPSRVVVIHNGVDPNVFSCGERRVLEGKDVVIGTAGRLVDLKGQEFLLRAAGLLTPQHPELRVAVAGKGPAQGRLERLARELGISDRVVFAGETADMPSFLRGLDLFVLPSIQEGFGLSLVEAMSCGLPVVGARVGGVPEIVVHGESGLVVEPADPGALAAALEQYLADPALARRMGAAARQRVIERFTIERMVRDYERLYLEALASPGGA